MTTISQHHVLATCSHPVAPTVANMQNEIRRNVGCSVGDVWQKLKCLRYVFNELFLWPAEQLRFLCLQYRFKRYSIVISCEIAHGKTDLLKQFEEWSFLKVAKSQWKLRGSICIAKFFSQKSTYCMTADISDRNSMYDCMAADISDRIHFRSYLQSFLSNFQVNTSNSFTHQTSSKSRMSCLFQRF